MSVLDDLKGKNIVASGIPMPDRKVLQINSTKTIVTDTPASDATTVDLDALVDDIGDTIPITGNRGSPFALVDGMQGGIVQCNNTSAINCTIPPDSSVSFPIGTVIYVQRQGTGGVTFVAGSGVLINARGLTMSVRWTQAQLHKQGTNTWVITGEILT